LGKKKKATPTGVAQEIESPIGLFRGVRDADVAAGAEAVAALAVGRADIQQERTPADIALAISAVGHTGTTFVKNA